MAKQTFQVNLDFIANINDLQTKIKTVTGEMNRMGSTSIGTQIQSQFDTLTSSIADLQARASQPITSQAEFNKLTSDLSKVQGAYNNLLNSVQRMQGASDEKKLELLPADQQARIKSAEAALKTFESATKSTTSSAKTLRQEEERLAQQKGINKTATDEMRRYSKELKKATNDVKTLREQQEALEGDLTMAKKEQQSAQAKKNLAAGKEDAEATAHWSAQLEIAKAKVGEIQGKLATIKPQLDSATAAETKFTNLLQDASTRANSAAASIGMIEKNIADLKSGNTSQIQTAFDQLRQKATELNTEARKTVVSLEGIGTEATSANVEKLRERFQQLKTEGLTQSNSKIKELAQNLKSNLGPALQKTEASSRQTTQAFERFNARMQELNQFKSQVTYFFSLTNSVYLLRAALQSAFETVKELDSVMTEAAVVTDFSVGDMWEKLPTYTDEATKLGASVKDLYSATTLYYQQGLKTNEAMGVGIETMKMARIASMDAAEATEAMTAALRGFNMAVDETNATHINDVYSNLAAITAADTEQIATAMTKTASIAHSANMEFETTAALLAQIIETTQEAPETAGTALKTIVARFSEVKELQSKGQNTGKDEEGEEIDVNKIDKALRSVGISMNGFFAGTEGLDEVLLKLAEKWDTLDFSTQRYIATMAAGSRQQSRFIAMMSDYGRTTELVNAASNSAGASATQFEKTLDSMESKLNKLQNAWDQFTMTIANNEFLKVAIDFLSEFLDTLNDFIDIVGGLFEATNEEGEKLENTFSKILKSVLSLATLAGGLFLGKGLLEVGFGFVGSAMENGRRKAAKKAGVDLDKKDSSDIGTEKFETSLNQGGESVKRNLTEGSKQAGDILIAAAEKAAGVETGGAEEETATEVGGGNAETAKEIEGGNAEATIEQESAVTETTTEVEGGVTETTTEVEGGVTETTTEVEGGVTETTTEVEGGVTETGTEVAGGVTETGTEVAGGVTETGTEVAGAGVEENVEHSGGNSSGDSGKGLAIAAIVAGIAIAIKGIVDLVEAWNKADMSAKIEEANNQIGEMQNQVKGASSALKELTNAETDLENMQETFKGLAKGTKEWRQQLIAINSQVLDLLNTYPELAHYISRGDQGQLIIEDGGWAAVQEQQEQRLSSALVGQAGAQMYKSELEEQQAYFDAQNKYNQQKLQYEEFIKSDETRSAAGWTGAGVGGAAGAAGGMIAGAVIAKSAAEIGGAIGTAITPGIGSAIGALGGLVLGGLVGGGLALFGVDVADLVNGDQKDIERNMTGGLTQDELSAFATMAAKEGISLSGGSSKEEFKQLYEKMGFAMEGFDSVYHYITTLGSSFDELANQTYALEIAQETYAASLISGAAQADSELRDSEFLEQITEGYVDKEKGLADEVENRRKGYLKNEDYVDKNGNATKKLISQYADSTGQTEDAVRKSLADQSLSADTMVTQLATSDVTAGLAEEMKATEAALGDLRDSLGKSSKEFTSLTRTLSTEGKDLTQSNLKDILGFINQGLGTNYNSIEEVLALNNADATKAVNAYLGQLYPGTSLDSLGLTAETFLENWEAGLSRFADGKAIAEAFNFDLDLGELSSQDYDIFMNKIKDTAATSTEAERKAVQDGLQSLMPEDPEKATSFINAISAIDWTSQDAVEGLSESLLELGLVSEEDVKELEELENSLMDMADASKEVKTEEVIEAMSVFNKAIKGVKETGEQTIDEEQYNKLSKDSQGLFTKIANEDGSTSYVYDQKKANGLTLTQVLEREKTQNYDNSEVKALEGDIVVGKEYAQNTNHGKVKTSTTTREGRSQVQSGGSETASRLSGGSLDTRFLKYANENENYALDFAYDNWVVDENKQVERSTTGKSDSYMQFLVEETGLFELDGYGSGSLVDRQLWDSWDEKTRREKWEEASSKGYKDYQANYTARGYDKKFMITEEEWKKMFNYDTVQGVEYGGSYIQTEKTGTKTYAEIIKGLADGTIVAENEAKNLDNKAGWGKTQEVITVEQAAELYKLQTGQDYQIVDGQTTASEILDLILENDKLIQNVQENEGTLATKMDDLVATISGLSLEELLRADFSTDAEREAANTAIDAKITASSSTGVYNQLKESIPTSELAEYDNVVKALTLKLVNSEEAAKNLFETLEELSETITPTKRNTVEYTKALGQLSVMFSNAFGLKISSTWLQQYPELVEQMVAGGEAGYQAYLKITSLMADQNLVNQGLLEISQLETYRAAIDDLPDEVGVVITGRTDGFEIIGQAFADLQTQLYLTEAQAEAFSASMASMGKSVQFTWTTVWTDGNGTFYKTDPGNGAVQTQVATSYSVVNSNTKGVYNGIFGGKTSGGGSSKKWENPYDEFYNSVAKINEELRRREKLELRYQRLLDRNAATARDLAELTDKQLESYKTERLDRTALLRAREAQMDSILEQYSDVGKYATYNSEAGQIEINWSALEALEGSTNENLTSRIEDYISKLEEQEGLIEEEQDALDEIEDAVWEIYDQGKDEYFNFEDRIKEALIDERQKEIDKLSEINDSINDTNSKILESMQQQIDQYRQDRDNEKTEKEISDKQRSLAYLQQDTSGANAMKILELQKEIDDAQQDYTDTLIDQKITELQDQNDMAAEQRQQQIDIMQSQLDYWAESQQIWEQVHSLIGESVDLEGNLLPGSKLMELLKSVDGFEGMSHLKKMDWLNELEKDVATSLAWLESGAMQSLYGMGATVEFIDAEGKTIKGVINKDGDVLTEDGRAYDAGSFKIDPQTGKITSSQSGAEAKANYETASKVTSETPVINNVYHTYNNGNGGSIIPPPTDPEITEATIQGSQTDGKKTYELTISASSAFRQDKEGNYYYRLGGGEDRWIDPLKYKDVLTMVGASSYGAKYKLTGTAKTFALDGITDSLWLPAYETGGLADFTGPAWLDGTKSRPEYILNADQTKAFFTLVDVLGSLQTKDSKASQNSGDSIYDIDINVESIGSDYDVEQMADTIKRLINEDARYRNNNTINLMR